MNRELLQQISDEIAENPYALDMRQWFKFPNPDDTTRDLAEILDQLHYNTRGCGTTACIAGWALALSGVSVHFATSREGKSDIEIAAMKALDLTTSQADRLFYSNNWPHSFKIEYMACDITNKPKIADIARRRIAFFLETGGTDIEVAR